MTPGVVKAQGSNMLNGQLDSHNSPDKMKQPLKQNFDYFCC